MALINRFSTTKLRIFTYNKNVLPSVLEDVSALSVALYGPNNALVYYENHPIRQGVGTNDITLPGYAFMVPTKAEAPYTALIVATFPDNTSKGNLIQLTVS